VKEDIGEELREFRSRYWQGNIFVDDELALYSALAGGEPWNSGLGSILAAARSPVSTTRANIDRFGFFARSGARMNLIGEGLIGGGCFVLRPDGSVAYGFLEREVGENAPFDDVVHAVRGIKAVTTHGST